MEVIMSLATLGFLFTLVFGIVLKIRKKPAKKVFLTSLLCLVVMFVSFSFVEETETKPIKENPTPKVEEKKETKDEVKETEEKISWEDKVKEVAATDGTETEKHDAIVSYARDYKATEKEITEFGDYIIQEYKDRNYLKDITNHEYMLTNIFKASVIDYHYDDNESVPLQDFAFDFLQNTKYNYRGAETAVSDSTLANEEQMNKALAEMGK
ncbi:hypothetical protein [Niallia sp. NCCP-28]|uniref:hypothetical protein n=1 Tax=Niallia sp. NCCP-28 TaxID=2934712 RepID=UPI00207E888A|nr:hypothetical protein [Niallia sp. NCCP-28]GKU81181.1 hypothetical protein NCCP28_05770 [Niallia sp. NCCP-28]